MSPLTKRAAVGPMGPNSGRPPRSILTVKSHPDSVGFTVIRSPYLVPPTPSPVIGQQCRRVQLPHRPGHPIAHPLDTRDAHQRRPDFQLVGQITAPALVHLEPISQRGEVGRVLPSVLRRHRQAAGQLEFGHLRIILGSDSWDPPITFFRRKTGAVLYVVACARPAAVRRCTACSRCSARSHRRDVHPSAHRWPVDHAGVVQHGSVVPADAEGDGHAVASALAGSAPQRATVGRHRNSLPSDRSAGRPDGHLPAVALQQLQRRPELPPAGQSAAAWPTGAARRPAAEISAAAAASDHDLIENDVHDIGIEIRAVGPMGYRFARGRRDWVGSPTSAFGLFERVAVLRSLDCVDAGQDETEAAPLRGVVGRAGSTSLFDLERWEPSEATGRRRAFGRSADRAAEPPPTRDPFRRCITHEWGSDSPRHGFSLPNTLVHGVVDGCSHHDRRARHRGGCRFRPGGFTARFGRDAAA